jgi:prolipoprotein diacylglyceryltransferase
MIFRQITHDDLGCASYLIGDEDEGVAAVVDPMFDIDEYLRLARYLVRDDRVYPFAIAVVLSGLAGARIAHIIDNPGVYGGDIMKMLDLSRGGIGTMGAPIGSSIGGLLACIALRLPKGFMFDVTVIGIALGEGIGRIGDIINGEHHSVACSGIPWCVRYTDPHTLGQATPVHPIGVYDALLMFGMALFGVLFTIYLTFLELFVINAVCIWCLSSAVLISLVLVLSVGPALEALETGEEEDAAVEA